MQGDDMATKGNDPVFKRKWLGKHLAIFENPGENGVFYKTTLQRVYKDGDEFKTTNSLSRDDLPVAIMLLQEAYKWILETEANKSKDAE